MHLALTLCTTLLIAVHVSLGASDVIDDSDPRIQYNGSWISHAQLNTTQYWAGTATYSNDSGATATVTFTGISVNVRGAYTPAGASSMHSLYTLDGRDPPVEFTPPNSTVTEEAFRVAFYTSGPIPYGTHVLVIKNLGEQFWLDSIDVGIPQNASRSMSVSATTTGIALPGLPPFPSTSASTISAGTDQGASQSSPGATNKSAVIVPGVAAGATVGGTLVLVTALIGVLAWQRRHRRNRRESTGLTPYGLNESSAQIMLSHAKARPPGNDMGQTAGIPIHTLHDITEPSRGHEPRESAFLEPGSDAPTTKKLVPTTIGRSVRVACPLDVPESVCGSRSLDDYDQVRSTARYTSMHPSPTIMVGLRQSLDGGSPPGTEGPSSPTSTLPPYYYLYQ
ncbi:hypothetical protein GY45DRAFT_1322048 [Cubamyces sp. BRFM 1775]|nr:hypothetical protein GY45DRAFT_1322048 [Cubamyces sp. BRFM 1775]